MQGYGVSNAADAAQQCASDPSFGRLACLDFALASFYGQGIAMNPKGAFLVRMLPLLPLLCLEAGQHTLSRRLITPALLLLRRLLLSCLRQWDPSDPDAEAIEETYRNWTTYFVAHRPAFLGHASVHLRRPTSRAYEATAFLLNAADAAVARTSERALAVLYNPTLEPAADTLELPLYYAGFAPGAAVVVSRVFPGDAPPERVLSTTVGEMGDAEAYSILVPFALPPRTYAMFSVSAARDA